jgi:uncharacterized iron-regulated membrane protein
MISPIHRPTDLAAIERRIAGLAASGDAVAVSSIWSTAGLADRYDIVFDDAAGAAHLLRIAGDGTTLLEPGATTGAAIEVARGLHHDLLAGELGDWIIGISGILLVTNIVAGLVVAWPRRGTWRIALEPATRGPVTARLYSWHRAVGLWLALPALLLATTGAMMNFPGTMKVLFRPEAAELPPLAKRVAPVGFARAASAATNALPGSALVAVTFPLRGDATYRVLLRTPQELDHPYGASEVLVDANDGSIRRSFPIAKASAGTQALPAIYGIHTGYAAGLPGRLLVLLLGIWLIAMLLTGVLLWQRRRRKKKA